MDLISHLKSFYKCDTMESESIFLPGEEVRMEPH